MVKKTYFLEGKTLENCISQKAPRVLEQGRGPMKDGEESGSSGNRDGRKKRKDKG